MKFHLRDLHKMLSSELRQYRPNEDLFPYGCQMNNINACTEQSTDILKAKDAFGKVCVVCDSVYHLRL